MQTSIFDSPNPILRCFALDLRSLATLRFLLGVILLFDLAARATDLTAHYTDDGVLPRAVGLTSVFDSSYVSLHLATGTWYGEAVLFIFAGLCALALTAGYRTRLATILCWIMTTSLHNRNGMVSDSGDTILRLALFWSMFLPLGTVFSIDSAFASNAKTDRMPRKETELSVFSCTYIIQLCLIYWCAYTLKYDPIWRDRGLGVFYSLQIDAFALPWGLKLREHQDLCRFLTYATLWFESCAPFLLFIPYRLPFFRFLAVVAFISFHASLALVLALGIFPAISIAMWIALLPTEFWAFFQVPLDLSSGAKLALIEHLEKWGMRVTPAYLKAPSSRIRRSLGLGLAQFLAGLSLLFIVCWNIRGMNFDRYTSTLLPVRYNWIAQLLRIDQDWTLFAPKPASDDGWYVIPGTLRSGQIVDVLSGEQVSWDKPEFVAERYINQRWRKYLLNLSQPYYSGQRLQYARYLCKSWNSSHHGEDLLGTFTIVFMRERTTDTSAESPVPISLWNHDCFG